jgi:CIC family chloride channel protein
LITLGFYGSGGIVGPLASICSGLTAALYGRFARPMRENTGIDLRMAAICGAGAAVSAIFHSPIGGGFFAAEVLKKDSIHYADLIPATLSGLFAHYASAVLLKQEPVFRIYAPDTSFSVGMIPWFLLVAAVTGLIGLLFIKTFDLALAGFRRIPYRQPAAACIGGAVVGLIWFFKRADALNISLPLYRRITTGDLSAWSLPAGFMGYVGVSIAVVLLLKITATSATIGSGLSGGFVGPCVILGVGSGALIYSILGFPIGDPEYFGFMACGMAAMLCAVLNIPIAAILLTVSLFGYRYILPITTGGLLAFILFKGSFLYESLGSAPASSGAARSETSA